MALTFEVKAGGGPPVGMYKGTFSGVEETPPHKEFGRGVKFKFRIVGGEHDSEEASVICGIENPASPKNRLGRVLGGLIGGTVQVGQVIDPQQYVGKTYLLQVEQSLSGTGTRIGVIMPNFS